MHQHHTSLTLGALALLGLLGCTAHAARSPTIPDDAHAPPPAADAPARTSAAEHVCGEFARAWFGHDTRRDRTFHDARLRARDALGTPSVALDDAISADSSLWRSWSSRGSHLEPRLVPYHGPATSPAPHGTAYTAATVQLTERAADGTARALPSMTLFCTTTAGDNPRVREVHTSPATSTT